MKLGEFIEFHREVVVEVHYAGPKSPIRFEVSAGKSPPALLGFVEFEPHPGRTSPGTWIWIYETAQEEDRDIASGLVRETVITRIYARVGGSLPVDRN